MQTTNFKLVILLIFLSCSSFGQTLKHFEDNNKKTILQFREKVFNFPHEVRYSLNINPITKEIEFTLNNADYLKELFSSSKDGIAVDLIRRDLFSCGSKYNSYNKRDKHFYGEKYKVYWYKNFKDKIVIGSNNNVVIKLGSLPNNTNLDNIEVNSWIIRKKYLSIYKSSFNLENNYVELFDLPLYEFKQSESTSQEIIKEFEKNLSCKVFFEKNTINFNKETLDSLRQKLELTDYNISNIYIKAYSSVEGDSVKNQALQYLRAENLITELSPYMTKDANIRIETGENWVGFLNDIQTTEYSYLLNQPKDEILGVINSKNALNTLEPILKKHRVGIIRVGLKKKSSFYQLKEDEMVHLFDQLITKDKLDEALFLQQLIFSRIQNNTLSNKLIDRISVPQELKYYSLINNKLAFQHNSGNYYLNTTIKLYEDLLKIAPQSNELLFNISILKIRQSLSSDNDQYKEVFQNIRHLNTQKFNPILTKKLTINYLIATSYEAYFSNDYPKIKRSLIEVKKIYQNVSLYDSEIARLAKFFNSFYNEKLALEMLSKRIHQLNASEDILFLYLNLTIIDPKYIHKEDYKVLIMNVIDKNRKRFCKMFNSNLTDGVTFQLLKNAKLKEIYCEECSQLNQ